MRNSARKHMVGFHLLDGAGQWVQPEQPEPVSALLVQFLSDHAKPSSHATRASAIRLHDATSRFQSRAQYVRIG